MGLIESRELEDCLNHVQPSNTLTEMCEGVELAIEAVNENLDLKRQKTIGVKTPKGFYRWTDESIKQIIRQRDQALLKISEVVNGLDRKDKP